MGWTTDASAPAAPPSLPSLPAAPLPLPPPSLPFLPATPAPADYNNRVLTHDRAMRAGLDDVGLGVLYGLYDYR